jgi:hypothetical protein
MVVSIIEFRKLRLCLETESDVDENSRIYSWINIEPSNEFIGKGQIIDIVQIKDI